MARLTPEEIAEIRGKLATHDAGGYVPSSTEHAMAHIIRRLLAHISALEEELAAFKPNPAKLRQMGMTVTSLVETERVRRRVFDECIAQMQNPGDMEHQP